VAVLNALMRIYSYLYHGLLALFLLALALLALLTGNHTLKLEMLPWEGKSLTLWLLGSALFALVSIVLAWMGKARILFFLWTLIVPAMLVRGYFFSRFFFEPGELRVAIWLIVGALLAIFGGWLQLHRRVRRPRWSRASV